MTKSIFNANKNQILSQLLLLPDSHVGFALFSHKENNLLPKFKPCFLIEKHINLPAVLYFYKAK